MPEDDPTKNLPDEDAPTAEPVGILPHGTDTRPMLDRILEETIKTRDLLMAEITAVRVELKAEVQKLGHKMDGFNKRLTNVETDLAAMNERIETLEENRP